MTAEGKITTTAITRQYNTKPGVRILVTQDPTTGALDYTYRKTGAVAVLVTGYATVAGSRQVRYQLQTSAGTLICAPSQTHWLARDKDKDALRAIAFDDATRADSVTRHAAEEIEAAALATAEDVTGDAERPDPERPISGHRRVDPLPLDNSADNAERGAAEGAEWAATLTQDELHQAIDAREATAESNSYNDAYTQALRTRLAWLIVEEAEAIDNHSPEAAAVVDETFEHQASTDGGKTWRTVAVGLEAADVDEYRTANEAGEGTSWRILPEGDDKARAIAMKQAELVAAQRAFDREANWRNYGGMRTKNFGRRADANLRRGAAAGRLVRRLESELDALRRPVREVPPLDLERLPYASHIRTDVGWYEVVKVNRKTVKVVVDPGWDDLIPIKRIREIRERSTEAPVFCGYAKETQCVGDLVDVEYRSRAKGIQNPDPKWCAAKVCAGHLDAARERAANVGMLFRLSGQPADEAYVSPWASV